MSLAASSSEIPVQMARMAKSHIEMAVSAFSPLYSWDFFPLHLHGKHPYFFKVLLKPSCLHPSLTIQELVMSPMFTLLFSL